MYPTIEASGLLSDTDYSLDSSYDKLVINKQITLKITIILNSILFYSEVNSFA